MQIKVVSKQDTAATVRKLCFGLIDQLIYLRNNNDDVHEITGYVFPTMKGCVQCVTCKIDDTSVQFVQSIKQLPKEDIISSIQETYLTHHVMTSRILLFLKNLHTFVISLGSCISSTFFSICGHNISWGSICVQISFWANGDEYFA